jgi:flagellar hook-length control protein FliK
VGKSADAADSAAKPLSGAAAVAAIDAATSTPDAAARGAAQASNTGASTNTDAAAQTANAATMLAAAPGVAAAVSGTADADGTDSPSSANDSPAPASNGPASDAAAPALAAIPAPVPISSPAAVAGAQAVSALANIGPADKHARAGAGDSSLPDTGGEGAAQLSANTTTATDAAPTPTLKVSPAVDTPEFAQGLADRVSLMVGGNLTSAKLQVNPPQLGPIDVRISVQGDQAQVSLTAHSAVTRDALESSSSKLREMLGAQGFAQVSVDISQRSFQERSTYAQPYDWTPSPAGGASTPAVSSAAASMPRASSGIVDAYA